MKSIIRLFAFFGKEIHEVRRQPRLVLSLIMGPFLILLLFGLGYMNQRPPLRISLVIPETLQSDERIQTIERLVEGNFTLVSTHTDPELALSELAAGVVEVVEIFPPDSLELMQAGQQVPMQIVYNDLDPQKAQFYEYSGYLQVGAINTSLLLTNIDQLQGDVSEARTQIADARTQLQQAQQVVGDQDVAETRAVLRKLDSALMLISSIPAAYAALSNQQDSEGRDGVQNLVEARQEIRDLDASLATGELAQQQERIQSLDERLTRMDERLALMEETSPMTIIAPIQQSYKNLSGESIDMMIYFTPSVLSLILQHIAITLGALSLVRERVRGALEFFGVAPISMMQVLVGKYLAYIAFLGVITALLVALLVFALGVPFLANLVAFTLFTLLFLVASIGLGFLVSVLSRTENQAVQTSMLLLLLSIFFSGFILPLEYFRPEVGVITALLPMSHANLGFRSLMLTGQMPAPGTVYALAAIALVTFILVILLWRKQFRQLA